MGENPVSSRVEVFVLLIRIVFSAICFFVVVCSQCFIASNSKCIAEKDFEFVDRYEIRKSPGPIHGKDPHEEIRQTPYGIDDPRDSDGPDPHDKPDSQNKPK